MEYKPIRRKKIYEQVADSLLESLKEGRLKPGDKLDSVEALAKSFDVGRSAIREALSALRAMGILEMHQGEGTYVKTFDPARFTVPTSVAFLMKPEDMRELLEVRQILEVGASGAAALSRTEEDLQAMEAALFEMERAKGNGDIGEQADLAFHMALVKAAHNQMLFHLMQSVSEVMMQGMRETRKLLHTEEGTRQLLNQHQRIFAAIKEEKHEEAQAFMVEHLNHVRESLSGIIS
ncbi:FadR/GntR family transcriptional regulator [Halobacillus sp. Cin3]|uniref:FadR/GntR family transcriptional regulator n=1 Tax=Halobacillus sp. Cin3 TaxID=2928441 RepID=UPI00248D6DF2|nr:FadR/GntR family transcriptional regulator [Halobacillus sp. Cin3]